MNRMFRSAVTLGTLVSALTYGQVQNIAAQQAPVPAVHAQPHTLNGSASLDGTKVNAALEEIASSLAATLSDAEVRKLLKAKVGERFDGDEEVLYASIADARLKDGKMFKQKLAAGYAKAHGAKAGDEAGALQMINKHIASVPRLQFAVPVEFESWNEADYVPLVAFGRVDIDDNQVEQLKAFDAQGNVHTLDAKNAPSQPVVVVGINERTVGSTTSSTLEPIAPVCPEIYSASTDYMCEPYPPEPTPFPEPTPVAPRAHAYGDREILSQIKINHDHEHWWMGAPEIYASMSFSDNTGIKARCQLPDVDDTGKWYYNLNCSPFYWQQSYGDTFINSIWEQDYNDLKLFTVTYEGKSYGLQIHNDDDLLGYGPVNFLDPDNGYYSVGDAEYRMRFVAP